MTIEASCHCGAVRMQIASAPEAVTDCNCSICRRLGARWAYYTSGEVVITAAPGAFGDYSWGDRGIAFHHCRTCGCPTHWTSLDPARDRMGVNSRLMEPPVVAPARVRRLDGADTWTYMDEAEATG